MTILGIMGSPRKQGNTHILLSEILKGAEEHGAKTKTVLLGDLKIRECDGCHACWRGRECPKMDDMNGLFDVIADSDAFVFGTPVYWFGPTALMKAFIDRFVYFNFPENREKVRGKPAALAIPFEENNTETAGGVVSFFDKCLDFLEMRQVGKILVPGVTLKGEIAKKTDVLEEARALGVKLAEL